MKSYTNLEQSKKLAEFLPIESADMFYEPSAGFNTQPSEVRVGNIKYAHPLSIPCWSLAALLEVIGVECRMEKTPLDQTGEFTYSFVDDYYNIRTFEEGNVVDAAVEMILKLHEQKLL